MYTCRKRCKNNKSDKFKSSTIYIFIRNKILTISITLVYKKKYSPYRKKTTRKRHMLFGRHTRSLNTSFNGVSQFYVGFSPIK